MSTNAQILANQKNAQASTGPRTPEGKERSSQNAIKYGVTSKQVVLPCEDAAEFDAMHNAWIDQLAPGTAAERLLVDDIAVARWQIQRVESAQKRFFQTNVEQLGGDDFQSKIGRSIMDPYTVKFQRYAATYRRAFESAWKKLESLQKQRLAHARAEAAERRTQSPAPLQNEPNRAPSGQPAPAPATPLTPSSPPTSSPSQP